MHIYNDIKTKEESKYEYYENKINENLKISSRICKIKSNYEKCERCMAIYHENYSDMVKRLEKMNKLSLENTSDIFIKNKLTKYVFGDIKSLDGILDVSEIIKQEKKFLDNYKNYQPGFFVPCDNHKSLVRELELDFENINYNKQILNKIN
jgi:recombinational DNA repair protein RecR